MPGIRVPVGRVHARREVKTIGLNGVGCKGIDTPVVPGLAVREVEQRRPGVVRVQLVRATDISARVRNALFSGVEDDAGHKAAATADLNILPPVRLGVGRQSERMRGRKRDKRCYG